MKLTELSKPDYLIDSHCHINYITDDSAEIKTLIKNANKLGVKKFLCVNINQSTWAPIQTIIETHEEIYGSTGLHPTETEVEQINQHELKQQTMHPKVVAIGETGLDYYQKNHNKKKQQIELIKQIEIAYETNLPLIIHTRSAKEDTLNLLERHGKGKITGVLHCFTEDLDMAERAIAMGFFISISGIVTFKNAKMLHEVVKKLPLERLLVETDSPYLAPMPYRGKTNQPAYTRYVAEHIATLKQLTVQTVAKYSTKNFYALFKKTAL